MINPEASKLKKTQIGTNKMKQGILEIVGGAMLIRGRYYQNERRFYI